MRGDGRLRPVPGEYDASWIREGVLSFDAYAVGVLVPVVFRAYGRVLHPASTRVGSPVAWATVAAWSGRAVHPLVQFDALVRPRGDATGPPPYARRPDEGRLPRSALAALCETLAAHTATPDVCFVGVWEGCGWLEPARYRTLRLPLLERTHLVLAGPLEAVHDVGWTDVGGSGPLLEALRADHRLEAWPVAPTDPITRHSDAINAP